MCLHFQASSVSLSIITFIGIALTNVVVWILLIKPTTESCTAGLYGFMISITVIYSPILVKTNRLYRIFRDVERGITNVKYASNNKMGIVTAALIMGQVKECYLYTQYLTSGNEFTFM